MTAVPTNPGVGVVPGAVRDPVGDLHLGAGQPAEAKNVAAWWLAFAFAVVYLVAAVLLALVGFDRTSRSAGPGSC
jgi:hypothetical protein